MDPRARRRKRNHHSRSDDSMDEGSENNLRGKELEQAVRDGVCEMAKQRGYSPACHAAVTVYNENDGVAGDIDGFVVLEDDVSLAELLPKKCALNATAVRDKKRRLATGTVVVFEVKSSWHELGVRLMLKRKDTCFALFSSDKPTFVIFIYSGFRLDRPLWSRAPSGSWLLEGVACNFLTPTNTAFAWVATPDLYRWAPELRLKSQQIEAARLKSQLDNFRSAVPPTNIDNSADGKRKKRFTSPTEVTPAILCTRRRVAYSVAALMAVILICLFITAVVLRDSHLTLKTVRALIL